MRTTRWIAVALATSTVLAQEPAQHSQEPLPTVQGDWLPFQIPDLDGNLVRYSDPRFAGKVLLVDLWGTWCPPCMAELPDIVRLYERFHDRGFEVLGVATEQMPKNEAITMLRKFVREREIPYTMVYGGRGHINYYQLPTVSNVISFPQNYIVGRDGKVRVAKLGIGDLEATAQLIEDLLDEPVPSIVAATQVEEERSRPVRADRDLLPFRGVDIKGRRYKNGYFFDTITYLDSILEDKPLLVLLWNSRDASSRSAIETMRGLHERYGKDALSIVAAAFEEGPRDPALDRLEAFVADQKIPYQVLYGGSDGVQPIAQTFPTLENVERVRLPTAILVDRDRRVREIFTGLEPRDRAELERAVDGLMAKRDSGQDRLAEIPDTPAGAILTTWLAAHNSGDSAALATWMRASFSPEKLGEMDFDRGLEWYVGCTTMFGKLAPQPYAIATDEEHKVVVHFLKDGVLREQTVDPTKIVVVELDVDPAQPRYLQRGLGLGELICEDRKDR